MTKEEVRLELEKYLGYNVPMDFLDKCVTAYLNGRHGSAALGGFAMLGYLVPFEDVLGHTRQTHEFSWPCREAISLGSFFRQKTEKGDEIRMCLVGTKKNKL